MNRGFSLIETLLVTSLLASLGAIAIPSLAGWMPKHQAQVEARAVQLALERAYAIAVTRSIPIKVAISPGSITATTPSNITLFSHRIRAPVATRIKGEQKEALYFYPSHTASPATITIENASYICSLVVSLRGRIRRECP
jgi:prepilin-type N-terminal cleavage/methylation domain-containing protein